MNVFFSWSGDRSRAVAAIFNEWLPEAIQAVVPFFSPEIPKGTAWFNEIAKRLESFSFGILFVTRDNLTAPWMMFEAGALFKHFGEANVCPLLFDDLTPADLQGALPNLNITRFGISEELFRLLKTINSALPNPLRDDVLQRTFDRIYPELMQKVDAALQENQPPKIEKSPDRQILEQILSEIQSGFAQSTQAIKNREDNSSSQVENSYLQRVNNDLSETLTLMERWYDVEERIIYQAKLPVQLGTELNSQVAPLDVSRVAIVFRDAKVIVIDRGRVNLRVKDDVDLESLSEQALQIAAIAVGKMINPSSSGRRVFLEKANASDERDFRVINPKSSRLQLLP